MGERERNEKPKINSQTKHVPKDAQVVMSIMKELSVPEYEPRVVNQMLEFTYRYVTCILDDAKVYANHARKKTIDMEDVNLATEMVLDKTFTTPTPRHILSKLAEVRNAMPLPPIKPHCGLRLPPDRYCLSACNYKLRAAYQPKKMVKSALERSGIKTIIKDIYPITSSNIMKRPNVVPPKAQVVTVPKPVIKFTAVPKPVVPDNKSEIASTLSDIGVVKMETDEDEGFKTGVFKRKREQDDFEVVP